MRGMLAPKESQGGRARVLAYRNFCSNRPTTLTTQVALKQSSQTDHYYAPLRAGMRLPIITLIPLYSSPATQLRGQDSLGQKSQQSQTQVFSTCPRPASRIRAASCTSGSPHNNLRTFEPSSTYLRMTARSCPLPYSGRRWRKLPPSMPEQQPFYPTRNWVPPYGRLCSKYPPGSNPRMDYALRLSQWRLTIQFGCHARNAQCPTANASGLRVHLLCCRGQAMSARSRAT